jgi:hypothetical protein
MPPGLTKKDQERRFVEILRDQLPSFPTGDLIDSESPDFIIAARQGAIGVEVTRIHKANMFAKSRRAESERRRLVAEALNMYERKNAIPLEVKVHFASDAEFNKRNRKHFALQLANLVMSHTPQPDSCIAVENNCENPSLFPYEIDSVSICRFSAVQANSWSAPSAGWVQEDFIPGMEARIAEKEEDVRDYNRDCIAYWLLIVAEGNSASTFFLPSLSTIRHTYDSSFDRVFFLEASRRRAWELTRN